MSRPATHHGWSVALAGAVIVAALGLSASAAVADHCEASALGEPDSCAGHVIVESGELVVRIHPDDLPLPVDTGGAVGGSSSPTADPECDPSAEDEPAEWAAVYEPCVPTWATDTTEVAATFDVQVAAVLSSIRVLLSVGLAVMVLLSSATLVVAVANR